MQKNNETLPLGVVIEKRKIDHPWQEYRWQPVAVIPGMGTAAPDGPWPMLLEGDGWVQFHAGTLPLKLFRKETEAYRINLSQEPPRIFVVARTNEEPEIPHEIVPFMVTASPYEAQDYLDSGEEIVEGVTMPPDVIAFVQAFVDEHHVEEPFYKRKRKKADPQGDAFQRVAPVDQARPGDGESNG